MDFLTPTQKAPDTQSVVKIYNNDRLADLNRVSHHERSVIALVNASTLIEATAVDPERNRKFLALISCWSDDIEVQTVLRYRIVPLIRTVPIALRSVSTS